MPELAYVSIGMKSVNFQHKDFVLMGGGGSFSAGGPGKGIYHWMHAATAYHHSYEDSGFFCIQGSAPPSKLTDCVHVITKEFVKLAQGTNQVELQRAKKQLQSMLMMNLEARPVIFEDVGRQILATGERKYPQELCNMIERVSNDDIVRVTRNMLGSKPAVAALGEIKHLPNLSDIESALSTSDGKLPQKFRLFGD